MLTEDWKIFQGLPSSSSPQTMFLKTYMLITDVWGKISAITINPFFLKLFMDRNTCNFTFTQNLW